MATAVQEEDYSSTQDSMDEDSDDVVPSFSFSGCGFLGVYHIGVASCLRDHTDVVNRKEVRFAGASAGALVATTLLCGIDFGKFFFVCPWLSNLEQLYSNCNLVISIWSYFKLKKSIW